MSPQVVIFIGTQGAGKGTQFKLLKQQLEEMDSSNQVFTFDTGQSLRELHSRDGYAFEKMRQIMNEGKFLPDLIPQWLLTDKLINEYQPGNHILIDGFPRSTSQAKVIHEITTFYGLDKVQILNMSVSESVAIKRALGRGRADDTEESVKSRLAETKRVIDPILGYIAEHTNYKVININGAQPVESVKQDIFYALGIN